MYFSPKKVENWTVRIIFHVSMLFFVFFCSFICFVMHSATHCRTFLISTVVLSACSRKFVHKIKPNVPATRTAYFCPNRRCRCAKEKSKKCSEAFNLFIVCEYALNYFGGQTLFSIATFCSQPKRESKRGNEKSIRSVRISRYIYASFSNK